MVERNSLKQVLLFQVNERTKFTWQMKIKKHVKQETIVYSDCWKGYYDLEKKGFEHKTINNRKWFKYPNTVMHTNIIEGSWSAVKASVSYKCVKRKLINPYLVRYKLVKNYKRHSLTDCMKLLFNQNLNNKNLLYYFFLLIISKPTFWD